MTHVAHHERTGRIPETARHYITAILTVIGVVAAVLGVWLAYGPADGKLSVFDWTWNVADISDLWAAWLMIGGGALAALSTGWDTAKAATSTNRWVLALETFIVVAGLIAVGFGVFLLF